MTNHVHFLVTPDRKDALPRFVQHIGWRYVRYFNFRYQRSGTLWKGRYKASLVDSEAYVLTCYLYIEINPVHAGMVANPSEYRRSSHRHNALGAADEVVVPHELYIALGADTSSHCRVYRDLFSGVFDSVTLHTVRESLNQELVLGNDRFREYIEKALARRASPSRRARPPKKKEKPYMDLE